MGITKDTFEEIGRSFLRLSVPVVYNLEDDAQVVLKPQISSVIKQIKTSDFSLFSCSRLKWNKNSLLSSYDDKNWKSGSKNNDWLFMGLAKFIHENPKARPVLVCVEYGIDVEATKQLIDDLGIGNHVIWLPILERKEIMALIQACDIGVGEFRTDPGVLWGGTGWEVLSRGKPLLQSFNFSDASFESEFGYPPPFMLDVKSCQDVAVHLNTLYNDIDRCDAIHRKVCDWFDRYNGLGLAKQWLDLLQQNDGKI